MIYLGFDNLVQSWFTSMHFASLWLSRGFGPQQAGPVLTWLTAFPPTFSLIGQKRSAFCSLRWVWLIGAVMWWGGFSLSLFLSLCETQPKKKNSLVKCLHSSPRSPSLLSAQLITYMGVGVEAGHRAGYLHPTMMYEMCCEKWKH